MSTIKVLHIIKSLGRGGAEMLLQETLQLHNKNQFEFHYIYFLPWKNQMVAGIQSNGGIVNNFRSRNNISLLFQVFHIRSYIKKNNISIVHCHLPWAGFVGRLIFKLIKIPVIYTEHNKQERYHPITKRLNKISFNWQSKAIAVSSDVSISIQENIKPSIPITTILNGVNTASFQRREELGKQKRIELGIDTTSILIGTIAVFRFQKRLKEWVSIFKKVYEKYPHVRGCIIGDGILKNEIVQHINDLGLQEVIILPGLQTDVKPWLSAIDIFMMTSEFEGLPIALLEAMSMKCAVVCTEAGGIKEVIRNGSDGFTESVENWEQLENPIKYLIQNPQEILNYGSKARDRVEKEFSLQTMVNQLETVYRKILTKE